MSEDDTLIQELLKVGIAAVDHADRLILEHWEAHRGEETPYSSKSDLTPVTEVDLSVERLISETVKSAFPTHRFLGEEFGESGIPDADCTWVLDPIDGTKSFARGINTFATQLAALVDHQVVIAISSAPALNERAVAVKGGGASINGRRVSVSARRELSQAYLIHGGIQHFAKRGCLDDLAHLARECWATRGSQDALSYHLLARGHVDVVVEANAKVWDIAAASLIVEEAGGRVTDFSGDRVSLETESIIATNGLLHDDVRRALTGEP